MFKSTCFTKVVLTLGNNWTCEWFSTNKTGKWKIIIIITCNFVLMWILFAVISFFPFSFKLPAMFVVTAIMQKFAAVSKSTETSFLVIFTYIWLIIPTNCCTQICWGPDRPLSERKKCSKDINSSSYVSKLKMSLKSKQTIKKKTTMRNQMTGPSKSFIHKINQSAVSLILSIAGKRTFQTQRTKLLSVEFTD